MTPNNPTEQAAPRWKCVSTLVIHTWVSLQVGQSLSLLLTGETTGPRPQSWEGGRWGQSWRADCCRAHEAGWITMEGDVK